MTTSLHNPTDLPAAALLGTRIEIGWSAVLASAPDHLELCDTPPGGLSRVRFVIALEPIDEELAILEAWIKSPAGSTSVLERRAANFHAAFDGDFVHLDAFCEERRILALTLTVAGAGLSAPNLACCRASEWTGESDCLAGRLLYASSPLPGEIGLKPAAFDPPHARMMPAKLDAASA